MPVSTIDIIVLIIIGLSAVNGLQRGLLLGVIDMLTLGASILVGARLAPWSAGPMRDWGLPESLAAGFGFFVSAVISYALLGLAARIVLVPFLSFDNGSALAWVNSILGLIPGAIRGAILASLVVIVISALPRELGGRLELANSYIAEPLSITGKEALQAALQWSGVRSEDIGLPSNVLSVEATESSAQLASRMLASHNHPHRADAS